MGKLHNSGHDMFVLPNGEIRSSVCCGTKPKRELHLWLGNHCASAEAPGQSGPKSVRPLVGTAWEQHRLVRSVNGFCCVLRLSQIP